MMTQSGLLQEEFSLSAQIDRELETEDLVLLSQLRRALQPVRPSLPYVADPSLLRPGATIAAGH
jgi:hypothetical protein